MNVYDTDNYTLLLPCIEYIIFRTCPVNYNFAELRNLVIDTLTFFIFFGAFQIRGLIFLA